MSVFDPAEALRLEGDAHYTAGRHAEALACYERVLALRPDHPGALHNRGTVLVALGRPGDALASYERLLALRPDDADALHNRGLTLARLGRAEEAVASYERALALRPGDADLLVHRGNALYWLGRRREASGSYARALALQPGHSDALVADGMARISLGDLAGGWQRFEARRHARSWEGAGERFRAPPWLGQEPLAGRTLLLHAEQGLGDTLHFVRYAPLAARRGARVVLEVQPPLVPLLAGLPGVDRVLAAGEPLPHFDLHCPLPSLPLAFGTTLESVPADVPYLEPPPDRVARWRRRLGEEAGPRVGVAWSGRADLFRDEERSLPLARLLPLLRVPGCRFVSLQREVRPADRDALAAAGALLHPGEELADFADTAALLSLLDLVISVDTAVAHLAGALARPSWVLLPFAPDWRWMLEREDSPWYPTLRLLRQPRAGAWDAVLARVEDALRRRLAGAGPEPQPTDSAS